MRIVPDTEDPARRVIGRNEHQTSVVAEEGATTPGGGMLSYPLGVPGALLRECPEPLIGDQQGALRLWSATMYRSGVMLLAVIVLAGASGCGTRAPAALVMGESVPDDVSVLAEATWGRFLETIPARQGCMDDVRLETSRELEVRGRYEPTMRVVTLRIPHTTPRLERTLVHEFAHHLEFSCPEHHELRAPFLAAQGHPPDTAWLAGASVDAHGAGAWAAVPSEQWAEAITEFVLGERTANPSVVIRPDTAALVRDWTRGEPLIGR
jgi:hypothetical protein